MRNDSNLSLFLIRTSLSLLLWPQDTLTNHEIFIRLILSATVLSGGWPEARMHLYFLCLCPKSFRYRSKYFKSVAFRMRHMPITHTKESGTEPAFMLSNIICEANQHCVWIQGSDFRPDTCIHWALPGAGNKLVWDSARARPRESRETKFLLFYLRSWESDAGPDGSLARQRLRCEPPDTAY